MRIGHGWIFLSAACANLGFETVRMFFPPLSIPHTSSGVFRLFPEARAYGDALARYIIAAAIRRNVRQIAVPGVISA